MPESFSGGGVECEQIVGRVGGEEKMAGGGEIPAREKRTVVVDGLLAASSNPYRRPPSCSAQALTTAEFGASLPAIVAQPPFSMIARRPQDEETLVNSTNCAAASA